MAENETPMAPVEGQPAEPVAPEPESVKSEPIGWVDEPEPEAPPPTPEPEPPKQLTPDEIMEKAAEQGFQKTASWIGRRDKELLDNIGNLIDSRLKLQQPLPSQPTPTDPAELLENPEKWARTVVPKILDEEVRRRSTVEQNFNSELIRQAASIMDNDPLFADKEFGGQVVDEIQKSFHSVNKAVHPALAAKLLVNEALASVVRKQAATKKNPLSGNQPIKGPMGSVTPPVTPTRKPKSVPLSDAAKTLAQRWNYSPEDLERVFGEQ